MWNIIAITIGIVILLFAVGIIAAYAVVERMINNLFVHGCTRSIPMVRPPSPTSSMQLSLASQYCFTAYKVWCSYPTHGNNDWLPHGWYMAILPKGVGFVLRSGSGKGDTALLAFKGTSAFTDLLIDLGTRQVKVEGGKVHSGFWSTYCKMKPLIHPLVKGVKTLHICGHSLGGALSILAGVDMCSTVDSTFVYALGTPKIGDAQYAEHVTSLFKTPSRKMYILINGADVIPTTPTGIRGSYVQPLPPRQLLVGYKDFGTWMENHKISTYDALVTSIRRREGPRNSR